MAKSIAELYINTMRKKYSKKYTAWEPDEHYKLGDYGFLKDGIFIHQGNVTQLSDDFKFEIDKHPTSSDKDYSFGIKKTITTEGGVKTDVIKGVDISTRFSIEFSSAGSIFYEAKGVCTHRIADTAALGVQIKKFRDLNKTGQNEVKWNDKYVVITAIDVAESATIMVSNTKGTEVCLIVKGDIGIADLKLADPNFSWKIQSETGEIAKYIAKKRVTPFFHLMGLERNFIRKALKINANWKPISRRLYIKNDRLSGGFSQNINKNNFSEGRIAVNSNFIKSLNKSIETIDFVAVENCKNWTGEEKISENILLNTVTNIKLHNRSIIKNTTVRSKKRFK